MGVILLDTWRYEGALSGLTGKHAWLRLSNRKESITESDCGRGVRCNWRWTSPLHAPNFVPSWGKRLMRKALMHYPICLQAHEPSEEASKSPDVTFIIGHRGEQRLPLLLLTLRSIANQKGATFECIVVEESFESQIEDSLPSWVEYIHLPIKSEEQPYNRSRTFNAAARVAKGKLFVFHDNDMLVPQVYASELLSHLEKGYQVANLKRFIFYLNQPHTQKTVKYKKLSHQSPEFILQNLTGGGSLAVERNAYFSIGGFDEGFVGWGGEDVEFWDRAQTLKVNNYGYLPLVHLWHQPQAEKNEAKNSAAMQRLERVLEVEVGIRIKNLIEGFRQTG